MRKLLLFTFVVLLPAVVVGISNLTVFPESAWAATIMLVVTVGVAAVFTWQSGNATAKISRYCICADFVIAAILCVNLGSHWLLAREVSAARQGVEERRSEEDREDRRKAADAERQLAPRRADAELAKLNAALQNAERRRPEQLPPEQRRPVLGASPTPKPPSFVPVEKVAPFIEVAFDRAPVTAPVTAPKLTPEQVRDSWWWRCSPNASPPSWPGRYWPGYGNGTGTTPAEAGKTVGATAQGSGETVAADDHSPSNLRGQNERTEESRRKQPGPAVGRDCIPGERGGQFAAQSVVRSAEPTDKKPERSLADDCPNKPPRVLPNTYWTRKGGGRVLEFKKKVKREWLYEYYGLLKMET